MSKLQDAINELAWYGKHLGCGSERDDGKSWREAFMEELGVLVESAKEEGRRKGMREAAEICRTTHENSHHQYGAGASLCKHAILAALEAK